jgi:type II secretory pathway pseudopilin PulG
LDYFRGAPRRNIELHLEKDSLMAILVGHPSRSLRSPLVFEGRGRAGFTLIEIVVVMSMLMVLILVIAATLWGAVKIERADSAVLQRVIVQAQLADRFREDVRKSVGCPDSFRDERASPECLILTTGDDQYIVYRWANERLVRREIRGTAESLLNLPVGGEHIEIQFETSRMDGRLITLRMTESRGVGKSRKNWPLEVSATLSGDRQ